MSHTRAEVPHGNFQTVNKRDITDNSELKIRYVGTVKRFCPFTVFNSQMSAWVNEIQEFELNLSTLWKVYTDALNLLQMYPDRYQSKRQLLLVVAKIGLGNIERDPKVFRKYLKEYNGSVERILWSPRVLQSEGKKKWLEFTFQIHYLPGLKKHQFPEVAYIGVGYRDKGNCRSSEHDGSPDWREVAMDYKFQTDNLQVRHMIPKDRTLRLIQADDFSRLRMVAERRFSKIKRDQRDSLLF